MTMVAICGYILCLFIGLLAFTVLYLIWTKQIDLSQLLSEANGDASMSRFQLLIFTFVIAMSLFEIVEHGMTFPDIPNGILTLLGISASTYAVGKGISYSQPDIMMGTGGSTNDPVAAQAAADDAKGHADEAKTHADDAKAHAAAAQQSADQVKPANS